MVFWVNKNSNGCPSGAASGALTGPVVTWEGPERGGSRVSVVVPGVPVPDQAPTGGGQSGAAESAPVQRTSFSISLDINTNIVSIQGSVTSPNLADRSAVCVGEAGKDWDGRVGASKGIGNDVTVDQASMEEAVEADQQAELVEEDEQTAAQDEHDGDGLSKAEGACGSELHADCEDGDCQEAAEAAAAGEEDSGTEADAARDANSAEKEQDSTKGTPEEPAEPASDAGAEMSKEAMLQEQKGDAGRGSSGLG
jgi:hypothetical protein